MVRQLVLLLSASSLPSFASNVQLLTSLPDAAVSTAIQLDAAGNIYLAGSLAPRNPKDSQDTSDAFVAKVSADGSQVVYFTILSGSFAESAAGIALGSDGSAYIAGSTGSSDFPVTAGALETTFNMAGASQGFLVKVNPAGTVVYSTFINGTAFTTVTGMAIDGAGEIFLTGEGGPGYPTNTGQPAQPAQGYILKLDAALSKVLLSVYGYGGGLISLDSQGNIYLAGSAQPNILTGPGGASIFMLPALPAGAFQSTRAAVFCTQAGGPGGGFDTFCPYQYVAKLDPTGKLLWGTYVTGTYGAIAGGMSVDSSGNVIVAGTTNSNDYPVTSGAFQTAYAAAAPPQPTSVGPFSSFTGPPNATGYVTKVNSTGTALVWSTYFGGSYQDQITGMAVSPAGDIILSGRAGSSDLVLVDTPDGCRPSANQVLGFVARLTPDGASAAATQLVQGAPDCLYLSCPGLAGYQSGWPLALRPDGTVVVAGSNGTVASVDFSASSPLACLTDPADNAQLRTVTPGQLVSLFGADLASAAPSIPAGGVAKSSKTFGVFFNGIPAPILYALGQQINVQVPFGIAGASNVQMQVVNQESTNPVSETQTLAVVERQPSIFLSQAAIGSPYPGFSACGGATLYGQTALALNADGTVNDCSNPASAGSKVTIFLNGFGPTTPALATGAIAKSPAVALTPSLDPGEFTATTVIATTSDPGSITGVAQVQLLPGGASGPNTLLNGASLGGTPTRERVIVIWTR
jgi:uncharacterized protein (TIGR03437 family)